MNNCDLFATSTILYFSITKHSTTCYAPPRTYEHLQVSTSRTRTIWTGQTRQMFDLSTRLLMTLKSALFRIMTFSEFEPIWNQVDSFSRFPGQSKHSLHRHIVYTPIDNEVRPFPRLRALLARNATEVSEVYEFEFIHK